MGKPHGICRVLLLAALLLPAAAGGSGDVLGAPSFDHATETTYRAITWADFKGKGIRPPSWNRWQQPSFAHIATTLRLGKYRIEERQQDGVLPEAGGRSRWLATAVGVRPYAIMNKDFSAVKHGARNAYTLDHEQLHFDIAETVARRLAVELAALTGRGGSAKEARADLERRLRERLDSGMRELDELQESYDGETAHGNRKKQQKKWGLAVEEMFHDATDALLALIEERAAAEPSPAGG